MDTSYQRLIHEHAEIDKLSHRLEIEVEEPEPDVKGVAALLGELSLAVKEHLASEDRSVYQRLIGAKHDKAWRAEVDFEATFQALRSDLDHLLGGLGDGRQHQARLAGLRRGDPRNDEPLAPAGS